MRAMAPAFTALLLSLAASARADPPAVDMNWFPKESDGFKVEGTETDVPANGSGDTVGETITIDKTSTGNTPATSGSSGTGRLVIETIVKVCPTADGVVEGNGSFTFVRDTVRPTSGGIASVHSETSSTLKFAGQTGDDAKLVGNVNVEADYSQSQSGSFQPTSGDSVPLPSASGRNHISARFTPGSGVNPTPTLGDFKYDVTQPFLSTAFGLAVALEWQASVYYSSAQSLWTQDNRCVEFNFDPPTKTVRLAPGAQVKVNTALTAKSDSRRLDANFNTSGLSGGVVDPAGGKLDGGMPIPITLTAPQATGKATGFHIGAMSRAGPGTADWWTKSGPKFQLQWQENASMDTPNYAYGTAAAALDPTTIELDDTDGSPNTWLSKAITPNITGSAQLYPPIKSAGCVLGTDIQNPPVTIQIYRASDQAQITIMYSPGMSNAPGFPLLSCNGATISLPHAIFGGVWNAAIADFSSKDWRSYEDTRGAPFPATVQKNTLSIRAAPDQ
jgi:hypothetical protein